MLTEASQEGYEASILGKLLSLEIFKIQLDMAVATCCR